MILRGRARNHSWLAFPSDDPRSFRFGVLSLLLASGFGTLTVLSIGSLALFICVLLLAIGLYPLARELRSSRSDLFNPLNIVSLYFVLLMGIRGLMVLRSGSVWLSGYDVASDRFRTTISLVFLYSVLALISLNLGYYVALGSRVARKLPALEVRWTRRRLRLGLLLCLAATTASLILYQRFLANFRGLGSISDRIRHPIVLVAAEIEQGGAGAFTALFGFGMIGILLAFAYRQLARRSLIPILAGFSFAALIVVYFLGFGGGKANLLFPLFQLAVCHHYLVRRWTVRRSLTVFVILLLSLPFIIYYRAFGLDPGALWGMARTGFADWTFIFNPVMNRSAGADMFFLIVDRTPSPFPYQFGRTFLRLLTMLVPRAVWPAKPWSFGVEFNRTYLDGAAGMSSVAPTLVGESYVNFHLVGVVVVFFLFGVFLRAIYTYCLAGPRDGWRVILYSLVLTECAMVTEGPLTDHVFFLIMHLVPFFLVGAVMRLRVRCRST